MKWWKRGLFALISLVGGFFSLDYLLFAFGMLTGKEDWGPQDGVLGVLCQIGGGGLFFLYAAVLVGYFLLIRKHAAALPTYREGKENRRWAGPRLELALQFCIFFTGQVLRFAYLLFIYLPDRFFSLA